MTAGPSSDSKPFREQILHEHQVWAYTCSEQTASTRGPMAIQDPQPKRGTDGNVEASTHPGTPLDVRPKFCLHRPMAQGAVKESHLQPSDCFLFTHTLTPSVSHLYQAKLQRPHLDPIYISTALLAHQERGGVCISF